MLYLLHIPRKVAAWLFPPEDGEAADGGLVIERDALFYGHYNRGRVKLHGSDEWVDPEDYGISSLNDPRLHMVEDLSGRGNHARIGSGELLHRNESE